MTKFIFTTPRLFKRLELPPPPYYQSFRENLFLHQMAERQITTPGNFTTGSMMTIIPDKEEYSYWGILQRLTYEMKYFMRPYKIDSFGCDERDISKTNLLTRAWLQHVDGKNNVIVTFERLENKKESIDYMNLLNYKTVWNSKFSDCQEANVIQQTLVQTDYPYKGACHTNIELK